MRLWHKDLISVLPRQQLVAQLRECVLIAKNIHEIGKPNHILVNKIMDYPIDHFCEYTLFVIEEMEYRNYNVKQETIDKLNTYVNYNKHINYNKDINNRVLFVSLFENWHNEEYLDICFYNLLEKFRCNSIKSDEWERIAVSYFNLKSDLF